MSTCCKCGRAPDRTLNERGKFTVELRPYGPGGADICFECATATPEAESQTAASFGALLDAHDALPGITTLSVDGLGKYELDIGSRCPRCGGLGYGINATDGTFIPEASPDVSEPCTRCGGAGNIGRSEAQS